MTRFMLLVLVACAAAPLTASAQEKPAPARPPSTRRGETPGPRPSETELRRRAEADESRARDMALFAPDMFDQLDVEMLANQASMLADMDMGHMTDMLSSIDFSPLTDILENMDFERVSSHASDMLANLDVDRMSFDAERLGREAEDMARRFAPLGDAPLVPMGPMALIFPGREDALLRGSPRASWAPDDPADSLYRVAREALNRGEYRRAAQLFSDITQKFPKSEYAQDCRYWEAFSRYRLGGTDDLKVALRILDAIDTQKSTRSSRESAVDIPALRARVQGALAARGDKESEERLRREASQSDGCDREEVSVRAEALAALGQMDMQTALPVVKKVLARRDECTVELRRRALYLVGRQADSAAATIILDVAKNDPDAGIRGEAMRWLPRVAGDAAVPQLEELLRTSTDEHTQRAAVFALGAMDSDRSRKAVRTLIERGDVAERVRSEAILSITRERDGRTASSEDIAYLRALYGKLDAPRLREAVLMALSRVESPDNQQFLLAVARNENEQPSLRAAAMQRIGRMQSVTAADIAKLYDVADARALREQILYALSQRKEPEAIDKMMDIARKDTDPQIRRTAISLLARSNNERAKKLLAELIDQ